MKKIILLAISFISITCHAQKVNLKKNKITVDDVEILDFNKKTFGEEFSIYKLNSKNEIIYLSHNRNGTQDFPNDDYKRLVFLENKITIESNRLRTYNWKSLVQLLIDDNVIDKEGNINIANLNNFSAKYNDRY